MGISGIDDLKPGDDDEQEELTEQQKAERQYPLHAPSTALANYRAGREIWDTNGDIW